MGLQKQSYRFHIAFILLLNFAATQLPFELFHSHNDTIGCIEKSNKDGICTHKSHIGQKERFCFACAVHVEKTFDLPSTQFFNSCTECNSIYAINNCNAYSYEYDFISLRGPPSSII